MVLQINNEELLKLNSERKLEAFYSIANDIAKRRSLAILHLKENQPGIYDADLLECTIPTVRFSGLKIQKTNTSENLEVYLQLNYKTIQMLKDGTFFIIKNDVLTIKNGTTVIKEPYQHSDDEIVDMYASYGDVTFDEESKTDELELTKESEILPLISSIISKPEAFINIQKNTAVVLIDGSFVYYSKENLPADLYINCYIANRISALITMVDKLVIKKGNSLLIEGYLEDEKIISNTSVVYEMPMDPLSESDLQNIAPTTSSSVIHISSLEFTTSMNEAKKSIGNFIATPFYFSFVQNGKGMSVKFKDTLSDSTAVVHLGDVAETEEDNIAFPDYNVYIPYSDLGIYTKGNAPLEIKYDFDNMDTSVLIAISDKSYIMTGKI